MTQFRKILFLIIIATAIVLLIIQETKKIKTVYINPNQDNVEIENKVVDLCFAEFGEQNERGLADKYTLRMSIDNEKNEVTGELKFLPAEKDSKVGEFSGTISEVDKMMMARTVNAWWETLGEGMEATEELKIVFGEGIANVGLGEMVYNEMESVYEYKDLEKLNYSLELTDVACSELDEREGVEKYIRENISTLSPIDAVLGGTWYVVSIWIDSTNKSGSVVYEDGHIQEIRDFAYELSGGVVSNVVIK